MTELSERALGYNQALLVGEYVVFGIGLAFLGPTTVLPALVRQLGGGPVVVGSLGAIQSGGWLLPQLFAGRIVANQPLVKSHVVLPLIASRAALALFVPVLLWGAVRAPGLALAALLVSYAIFNVADALGSVGWFELLGKCIPAERRGRALGLGEALSGLFGIAVGAAVAAILARRAPFPANNTFLLILACLCFSASVVALAAMKEPQGVTSGEVQPRWREYLPRLLVIVRSDRDFRWLVVLRGAAGLADMASAFYVLYAVDRLGMPQEEFGLLISAGVVGTLLGALMLGHLSDRLGSAQAIKAGMIFRCLRPALALLAPLVAGYHRWAGPGMFVLIFALGGAAGPAHMIGFMNRLLEIAPPAERTAYVALANTLEGLVTVAPLLAGWLLQATSYEALLGLTLILALLGLVGAVFSPATPRRPAREPARV